jgi:hypothetical protein
MSQSLSKALPLDVDYQEHLVSHCLEILLSGANKKYRFTQVNHLLRLIKIESKEN